MKQSYDQKKGSADCDVTGSKKGMPGESSRNSVGSNRSGSSNASQASPESNSRERKSSPSSSHSREH